jgi:hypothetical protein
MVSSFAKKLAQSGPFRLNIGGSLVRAVLVYIAHNYHASACVTIRNSEELEGLEENGK